MEANSEDILLIAARDGNLKVVKEQIKSRVNINTVDNDGWTPLLMACLRSRFEIVKCLLEAGASVNKKNPCGMSPLLFAAKNGNVEIVKALIKAGADIEVQNIGGWSPLCLAAKEGHLEVVEYLIEAGANLEMTEMQITPLMSACKNGHLDVVKSLILSGANISAVSQFKETSLDIAFSYCHYKIAEYIVRYILLLNPWAAPPKCVIQSSGLTEYWEMCKVEAQIFDRIDIEEGCSITLLKLLQETNMDKVVGYMSNQDLQEFTAVIKIFSRYEDMIKEQCKRGSIRKSLRLKAEKVMQHGKLGSAPPELISQIFNNLTNTDLQTLIKCI